MIEFPPKLTIRKDFRRPAPEQIAAFRDVPVSVVSDAMFGAGALDPKIRHMDWGGTLPQTAFGPAVTADCGPGDNLALAALLGLIPAGAMVVATCHGHTGCAVAGDRLTGIMRNNGAAGLVTDAPMRDFHGVVATGLPVWCRGLNPASPFSSGPGTIGLPIQIGGQRIETGDMVVADRDGVVVVPYEKLDAVIARVKEILALEGALDAEISNGLKSLGDMDALLASDEVAYVD
ncbi:MAG: RraA family protein [Rhodobiaceae bacterium]|nr:RraA family protein [Rhodobiaceae bacterium]